MRRLRDNLEEIAILTGLVVWLASGLTAGGFAACFATTFVLLAAVGAASKRRPLRGTSGGPEDARPIAPPPARPIAPPPAPPTSVVPAALLHRYRSSPAAAPPRPDSPPPPPRPDSPPPGPSRADVERQEVVRTIHHLFWFQTLPRFLERLPDVARRLASDELDEGFARALCAPEGPIVSYVSGMAADLKVGPVELPVARPVRRPFGVALLVFQPGRLVDFTAPRAVVLVPRRPPAPSLCFTLEEGLSFGGLTTFVGSLTADGRWLRHGPMHQAPLGPRPPLEQQLEDFLVALEPLVAAGGAGGEPHPHARQRRVAERAREGGPGGSVLSSELPEPGGPPPP